MSSDTMQNRLKGLTLVEILVVITVLSILVALILPAVQYAREASRRLSCANNLKQIGLALASYEGVHRSYPQGANGWYFSAHTMILPNMEQLSLYNSINFNASLGTGGFSIGKCNYTAGQNHLAVFCCPTDPDSNRNATTNYGWNGGFGLQDKQFVGTFTTSVTRNSKCIGVADVTDGLANTAAMSEWKLGRPMSDDDTTVVFRVTDISKKSYLKFIDACDNSSRSTQTFGAWTKDAHWSEASFGSTILNFNSLPNFHSCFLGYEIDTGNWPASSYHTRGANALYHDGHVAYFASSTGLSVWRSVSTRAGSDGL